VALVGGIAVVGGAAFWVAAAPPPMPVTAGPSPLFVEETAGSGLVHTYQGDFDFAVGGGVATFDCNDDGRPDVYVAGGERPAQLFVNESPSAGRLRFSARANPATDLTGVTGAYPIDVDGDGSVDLVVLRNGRNVALRGLGGCGFEDVTTAWALGAGEHHTEAFSAMWEPGAQWPTIAFGNYVDPALDDPSVWCEPNELVRPRPGARSFGDPLALSPSWCTLSLLFSDWSGSGRMDLRVSNDSHYYRAADGEEQLWRVAPGEPPREYGADDGWVRVQVEGMGIASYDVTGDGLPDVFLTSQGASRLQTLTAGPGQPTYRDIGAKRGVNAAQPYSGTDQRKPSTAWHPEFDDVNNDGFVDLFVSKGNVDSQPEFAIEDPSNLLLGQPDGSFVESADRAGIVEYDRGRGAALADFNLDGRLDLIEVSYGAPVRVWRNAGAACSNPCTDPAEHWLAVRARQPGPNVDAIGGEIDVRLGSLVYRRELTIGGGHAGGQLGWAHFGLGPATSAEIQVRWPDGTVTPWQRVPADGFEIVDHVTGTMSRWAPGG
jgi:hypothetical protein